MCILHACMEKKIRRIAPLIDEKKEKIEKKECFEFWNDWRRKRNRMKILRGHEQWKRKRRFEYKKKKGRLGRHFWKGIFFFSFFLFFLFPIFPILFYYYSFFLFVWVLVRRHFWKGIFLFSFFPILFYYYSFSFLLEF